MKIENCLLFREVYFIEKIEMMLDQRYTDQYLLKNHYEPYSQNWYQLTPLAHGLNGFGKCFETFSI